MVKFSDKFDKFLINSNTWFEKEACMFWEMILRTRRMPTKHLGVEIHGIKKNSLHHEDYRNSNIVK